MYPPLTMVCILLSIHQDIIKHVQQKSPILTVKTATIDHKSQPLYSVAVKRTVAEKIVARTYSEQSQWLLMLAIYSSKQCPPLTFKKKTKAYIVYRKIVTNYALYSSLNIIKRFFCHISQKHINIINIIIININIQYIHHNRYPTKDDK